MAEKLEVTELKLVCPRTGKTLLTLCPADDGAGLWIEGPDGNTVAVYSVKGQTGIGIYGSKSKAAGGMPIGLTVDAAGDGYIQIRKGDSVKQIGFDDLK